MDHALKKACEKDGVFLDPIYNLKWDYKTDGIWDPHKMASKINGGYLLEDAGIEGTVYKKGILVTCFASRQADGATSSDNYLYCNSSTEKGDMPPTGLRSILRFGV